MNKYINSAIFLALVILSIFTPSCYSGDSRVIELPTPQTYGGKPLMEALKERRSERGFSSKDLPLQIISDMLWAANGINRPDSAYRTAPSTMNMQEIDIYVSKSDGLYLYDVKANSLILVKNEDIRPQTGLQPFVKDAPINLIFVADFSKMGEMDQADKVFYAAADTGFVSENIYLYCASQNLATVVRGWLERASLAKAMGLGEDKKIILAQTVGYPKGQ